MITVDILLATYNGSSFLAAQIDSILQQDYPHLRLLIRDDCSQDGTEVVIQKYAALFPSKIVFLPSEKRLGIKGNFSTLMEHSTANYILFADQDDVWEKDKVSKTLAKMKELESHATMNSGLLVHTDLKVVDENLHLISDSFWNYAGIHLSRKITLNRLLAQNVVTGCTVMINKPLLQLAWPIPETTIMHDWWLALVAVTFGKIGSIPESTLLYRQHSKNTLGARKFCILKNVKQRLKIFIKPDPNKCAQANELLKRYHAKLNEKQKQTLKTFIRLPRWSFFKQTILTLFYLLKR